MIFDVRQKNTANLVHLKLNLIFLVGLTWSSWQKRVFVSLFSLFSFYSTLPIEFELDFHLLKNMHPFKNAIKITGNMWSISLFFMFSQVNCCFWSFSFSMFQINWASCPFFENVDCLPSIHVLFLIFDRVVELLLSFLYFSPGATSSSLVFDSECYFFISLYCRWCSRGETYCQAGWKTSHFFKKWPSLCLSPFVIFHFM